VTGADDASVPDAADAAVEADAPIGCPSSPPKEGTACVPRGMWESYCSYGDDPLPDCRDVYRCTAKDGVWTRVPGACDPSGCPAAVPLEDASCPGNAHCLYGRRHCACQFHWSCSDIPSDCPLVAPNAGDPCTPEASACGSAWLTQLHCADCGGVGFALFCNDGVWDFEAYHGGP
jgi:hypothetical protein